MDELTNGVTVIVVLGLVGYFLPSIISILRWRTNTFAILMLNLFLGWTLIGWVVSLVWSVSAQASRQK